MNSQWWFWLADMTAQQQEEEEDLTQYQTQSQPLTNLPKPAPSASGWEFKIVRSQRNIFHQPETLKQVCQEEAQGGWVLLEKLDDRRLRFKRPMHLRQKQLVNHSYDPYRSFYGSRWSFTTVLSGMIAVAMTALPAYLAYRLVTLQLSQPLAPSSPRSSPMSPWVPPDDAPPLTHDPRPMPLYPRPSP